MCLIEGELGGCGMCHNHVRAHVRRTRLHTSGHKYVLGFGMPHTQREKNDKRDRVYMYMYVSSCPQLELQRTGGQPLEGLPTRRQSCGPASAATRWRRYKSRSERTARRSAEVLVAQRESRNPQRPLQPIRSSASGRRRAEEGYPSARRQGRHPGEESSDLFTTGGARDEAPFAPPGRARGSGGAHPHSGRDEGERAEGVSKDGEEEDGQRAIQLRPRLAEGEGRLQTLDDPPARYSRGAAEADGRRRTPRERRENAERQPRGSRETAERQPREAPRDNPLRRNLGCISAASRRHLAAVFAQTAA